MCNSFGVIFWVFMSNADGIREIAMKSADVVRITITHTNQSYSASRTVYLYNTHIIKLVAVR